MDRLVVHLGEAERREIFDANGNWVFSKGSI
jgi:hypothetical protein